MSDYDRGAYTPQTDAPLAFDARPARGRRPMPMALMGSAFILLVLLAAVLMTYRHGVRAPGGAPSTVGEPVAAVKTAPPPDAQAKLGGSNLDVYVAENTPPTAPASQPSFAPAPEEPAARPAPKPAETTPVQSAPIRTVPSVPATTPTAPAPAKPTAVAAAPAKAAPAVVAAAPVKPAAPAAPAKPVTVATATPAPAAAAATGGAALVQIGVFSTSARADTGWAEVVAAFPTQLRDKTKKVESLEQGGRTLYRSSIAGFASKASAQAFCDTLKASGRACVVRG